MFNQKNLFKGKAILITGGTGFLGKSLVKEILKHDPQSIRVFSRDEVKHHIFQEEMRNHPQKDKLRNLVGDVRDYDRFKKAMKGCDIVIHCAALKRIDMIEYNVEEAIKTNILGTVNLVRAAIENDVEKVIFVSTDKACSPINTYGACKLVSERIVIESNFSKGKSRTIFTCVRYGNVINSTGSVIPFFIDKLNNDEDMPLTHEKMTRFLISQERAVDLIFNAIKYSIGGEIFVPKLPSVRITDLINTLKDIYGKNNRVIKIGVRPGEKIHELMINEAETPRTYEFGNNYVIISQIAKYQKGKTHAYLKNSSPVNFKEYSSESNPLEFENVKPYLQRMLKIK